MMRCYLLDGDFSERDLADLGPATEVLELRRKDLQDMPMESIIALLGQLGKDLVKDREFTAIDGASFISLWLRRDNLERLGALNYGNIGMMDGFREVRPGMEMRAQPRGISCHWLPNNVPTLSFFSLMLAILSKNACVLKVSDVNRSLLTKVLQVLAGIVLNEGGKVVKGETIVRTVCMVSFDSSQVREGAELSSVADIKIVWGSSEAVRSVVALPQKDTCDQLVFGPKYSLAVFDQKHLERPDVDEVMKKLAIDISLFNQAACSSPQVVFLEKGAVSARRFAELLAKGFDRLPARLKDAVKPEPLCLRVINVRGAFLLDPSKDIVMSKGLGWTILIDPGPGMPEPVQGSCIFVKEVDDLRQVIPWITKKVQTVALCIDDPATAADLAEGLSYAGVDRMVLPGEMNDFTLPWDGILPLGRMVRWVTIRRSAQ